MVGLRNDTIILTPLEQAIKGKTEIDESCLESLISCRRKYKNEVYCEVKIEVQKK
jgi:hypothetical protein